MIDRYFFVTAEIVEFSPLTFDINKIRSFDVFLHKTTESDKNNCYSVPRNEIIIFKFDDYSG